MVEALNPERYDELCRLLAMATGAQRLRLALMGVGQVRRMALGVLNGATIMLDGQVVWGRHHMPPSAGGTGTIRPGKSEPFWVARAPNGECVPVPETTRRK